MSKKRNDKESDLLNARTKAKFFFLSAIYKVMEICYKKKAFAWKEGVESLIKNKKKAF